MARIAIVIRFPSSSQFVTANDSDFKRHPHPIPATVDGIIVSYARGFGTDEMASPIAIRVLCSHMSPQEGLHRTAMGQPSVQARPVELVRMTQAAQA